MYFLIGGAIGFVLGAKWAMDNDVKARVGPWIAVAKKYIGSKI